MLDKWVYLGDGVYAKFDGMHMTLATGSHAAPKNIVHLDPHVLGGLLEFISLLRKAYVSDEPADAEDA